MTGAGIIVLEPNWPAGTVVTLCWQCRHRVHARADHRATAAAIGLITEDGSGHSVVTEGTMTLTATQWNRVIEHGSLVVGTTYYLSADSPGKITPIAPTTPGLFVTPIGIALSDTMLLVRIERSQHIPMPREPRVVKPKIKKPKVKTKVQKKKGRRR